MKFVFNELCMSDLEAFTQDDFNRWLNEWLEMLVYSHKLFNDKPCIYSDCSTKMLLPDPYIKDWMATINRDKRSLFFGLTDRHPCLDKKREPVEYDEFLESEFFYKGKSAKGLGVSCLLEGIAFSFPSKDEWDVPYLNVSVNKIDEDRDISYDVKVKHALNIKHLNVHKQYLESYVACLNKVCNLEKLIKLWEEEFPRLIKSSTLFEFMEKTPLNKYDFSKIVENLFKLNKFLSLGKTDIRELGNCSDESDTTKQKYGKTREFMFGMKRKRCYLHLKLWRMNWRIQFCIDYKEKLAYVGYIGEHLPI